MWGQGRREHRHGSARALSSLVVRVGGHGSDLHQLCQELVERGWEVVDVEGDDFENNVAGAVEVTRRASEGRLKFAVWVDSDAKGAPQQDRTITDGLDLCRIAMASGGDIAWTGTVDSATWRDDRVHDAVNEWSEMRVLVSPCGPCDARGDVVVFTTLTSDAGEPSKHLAAAAPTIDVSAGWDPVEGEFVGAFGIEPDSSETSLEHRALEACPNIPM